MEYRDLFSDVPEEHLRLVGQQIEKGINSPLTSSGGRLFDGVAAMLGMGHTYPMKDKPPASWKI